MGAAEDIEIYKELSYALSELEQTPGWEVFLDGMKVDFKKHQDAVMSGQLTPDRYQFECGWLAGASYAFRFPEVVKERYLTLIERAEDGDEE